MTKLILADDLTGALDSGVKFLIDTPVIVQNTIDLDSSPQNTLVVLNTKTRDLQPDNAKKAIKKIIDSLARSKETTLIFKKIDSNMRGNIGVELEMLHSFLKFNNFLLCPANPPQGRKVLNGKLFLNNELITEKSIPEILASQTSLPVRHLSLKEVCSLSEHPNDFAEILNKFTIVSFDAVDLKSLLFGTKLLKCAKQLNRKVLPVGSAGFANVLALTNTINTSSVLMISGSLHPRSIGQVKQLLEKTNSSASIVVSNDSKNVEGEVSEKLQKSGRCIVLNSFEAYPERTYFLKVIKKLGKSLSKNPPNLIIVNGGETASALLEGMNVSSLKILGELENGVVLSKSSSFYFVSKSGGFGNDDSLLNLAVLGGFST